MTSNNAERKQRIKEQSKEVANYMARIEPLPELVYKLRDTAPYGNLDGGTKRELHLIDAAYRAGADMELEACIKLLADLGGDGEMIRRYRRPAPPTPTKEEALDELFLSFDRGYLKKESADLIRRAIESLPS